MRDAAFNEIRFEAETKFLGRSGYFACSGVEISDLGSPCNYRSTVDISPLTSKGDVGRCRIEIPASPKTLRKIAEVLKGMADAIESDGDQRAS